MTLSIKTKIKNRTRKVWQRTRDSQLKTQINHMTKEIAQEIKNYKNEQWDRNDNSLWKFTKN